MSQFVANIRRHPLIDLLFTLKGNPRVCVYLEPLWGIPHNLIAPFAAIYMRALGASNIQIGLAISASMLAQVIWAFLGGVITDKLGRKRTTILGDFLGWALPCAIWAIAQNYWFCLAAMVLNCFEQVNQTAWVCLLVEDAEEKQILNIWNLIILAAQLAVFFSPISGALIRIHSLVPVMRVLYGIFSVSMLVKCVITILYTTETAQGKIRREQSRNQSLKKTMKEYWGVMPMITKNRDTINTLIIMVILNITMMVNGNFYYLYATSALGIPDSLMAYFPIIRAIIMLIFFALTHKLAKYKTKAPMTFGLMLYIAGQLLLILSPKQHIAPIAIYTLLEALAFGLVYPRKELMTAVFVDKQERARIVAMLTTFMIAIAMPFGAIAGYLSKVDDRLPFILNVSLYLIAAWVIITMKHDPGSEDEAVAEGVAIAEE